MWYAIKQIGIDDLYWCSRMREWVGLHNGQDLFSNTSNAIQQACHHKLSSYDIVEVQVDEQTQQPVRHSEMTLRDYFAAQAMQGLLSVGASENDIGDADFVDVCRAFAESAYQISDAMLKARENKE